MQSCHSSDCGRKLWSFRTESYFLPAMMKIAADNQVLYLYVKGAPPEESNNRLFQVFCCWIKKECSFFQEHLWLRDPINTLATRLCCVILKKCKWQKLSRFAKDVINYRPIQVNPWNTFWSSHLNLLWICNILHS